LKERNMLVLMLILITMFLTNTPSSFAEENLRIDAVYAKEVHIKTLEPFQVYVAISNPDSVGHLYRVMINFEDYILGETGYISADSSEQIWLYLIPTYYGKKSIGFALYQDQKHIVGIGLQSVDVRTLNITVGKSYQWTQVEDLNEQVENLESEILRLNDVNVRFTYNTIFLAILILAMGLVFWWRIRNQSKSITV